MPVPCNCLRLPPRSDEKMDQERVPESPPEAHSDAASPVAFLDLSFISRVYRTTAILVVVLSLLLWETRGLPACLGLLIGTAVSLAMLWSLELGVRRFISPEQRSPGSLLGLSALKLLLVALVLVGAFLAARRGWVALLWVLVGFALPHVVLVLKLVGQKMNEAMNPASSGRRN